MFSALAPILRKAIVARQPVFSSSLGFAARAYAVSASTSQVQPERVVSNWENPIGDYAVKTETFTRDLDEIWRTKSKAAVLEAARHPPANPYAGRSVKVSNNDVGDALARLNGILSRNKVRAQLYLAQRHEKKGVKRRRLESERWRRQFAHEVRNKVQLTTKIRNRGA